MVIGPSAYGGSSLLRMLAAVPLVQPLVLADARMQTVAVEDVAQAVLDAVQGGHVHGDYDLVEETPHRLDESVAMIRRWLGFPPARAMLRVPRGLGFALGRIADLAGWFGWRSPIRTTALKALEDDVTGDPEPWRAATGAALKSLPQTLASLPSTLQERLFARAQLVFPFLVLILAVFWLTSGIIGLWQSQAAVIVLGDALPPTAAWGAVIGGGIADLLIGAAFLFRRWLRPACFAAIAVSIGYLLGGTILTPHLWADPLGVFVKVFPGIGLALAVAALAEER